MDINSFKQVHFLDKEVFEIVSNRMKQDILKYLNNLWNRPNYNNFPGSQPVSIEKKDLFKLFKFPYYVCEKTDGYRMILFCFNYHGKNISLLINRITRIFFVTLTFDNSDIFKGTIIDGELINNCGKWTYVIYDAVSYCGKYIGKNYLSQRLNYIKNNNFSSQDMEIKIKKFYPMSNIKKFTEEIYPNLDYPVDGLIFTPEKIPIQSGTQYSLFKWKPRIEKYY